MIMFKDLFLFHVYKCLSAHVCVYHMHCSASEGQMGASVLQLDVQVIERYLVGVGTEPGSCLRMVSALNCCSISLALFI